MLSELNLKNAMKRQAEVSHAKSEFRPLLEMKIGLFYDDPKKNFRKT